MWLLIALLSSIPVECAQKPNSREILTIPAPAFDHRIAYGSDANQFGELRLPKGAGPHPVVTVIHGGFWRAANDLGRTGHMSAALTSRGFASWNIEYRRIGQRGGGWPGTMEDAGAAVDHLRRIAVEYKLDLRCVVVAGHSAGGHLALWLATRKGADVKVAVAVALAGVSDLRDAWKRLGNGIIRELLGGGPEEFAERFRAASPVERLPAGVPLRLIHGDKDDIVPVEMSEEFARCKTDAIQQE